MKLHTLKNTHRPGKRRKLLGRGMGSGKGKTSGRGVKGMGARSGYKKRLGYIGGGVPLHRRLPTRGFSNARFAHKFDVINLDLIDAMYQDGETVSLETLREKRLVRGKSHGIKLLGKGKLTKKVSFEIEALSESARTKIKDLELKVRGASS